MNKVALVTGASGFIGRHVSRGFSSKDYHVVGIGHGTWENQEWRHCGIHEWHQSDVSLESLIAYVGIPDVVVHCAGSGSVSYSMSNPYLDFQSTVNTTAAVLEFARIHAPLARIVYPSSAGIYGCVEQLPIKESFHPAPVSYYGIHKLMAEMLCKSYAKNASLNVAIVRMFSIYGEGLCKQLLWDTCKKIQDGQAEFFGTGEESRDWLHIDDAVRLLIMAGDKANAECPVVNCASGVGVTNKTVIRKIYECFGAERTPIFIGTSKPGDPAHYVADIDAITAWGWKPEIVLDDGLSRYCQWFKGYAQ